MSKKTDARSFALQKRRRRQWITTVRMVRYGVNNFSRNAWLTIAATAVMTITLLSIFITFAARDVLINTASQVQKKVNISIYVGTDTPKEAIDTITNDLKKLSSVQGVQFVSPEQARSDYAKQNSSSRESLNALNEATNRFPGTFQISLQNINDTTQLSKFTDTNQVYKEHADPARQPSFKGSGKNTIQTIGSWVGLAEKVGYIMSAIFVALAILIVFNTIRMAIFNRKDEIEMMKLIGADRSFIRGPFIVEAVVYGFIAAVFATALGMLTLFTVQKGLSRFGAAIDSTVTSAVNYIGFIALAMILVGALIGIVSSLLATRRYLKI